MVGTTGVGDQTSSLLVAWRALAATLAIVVLRIWHLLLFKQAANSSAALAGWLVVCWLLIGLGRAVEAMAERRSEPSVPRLWSRLNAEQWSILALFSVLLLLFNSGFMRATGDGRGYFAQLHSLVFDRDLDFTNNIAAFGARPGDASFPIGTAILWVPFYLGAHLWLGLLNLFGAEHIRDGFWNPYQRAIGLGTLLYGFAAVLLIAATLRRWFDRPTALTSVAVVVLATPVVWYVAVDASMSHGPSLFSVTSLLALWVATRGRRTRSRWVLLMGVAVMMIAVRPQNALFALVLPIEALGVAIGAWRDGDRERAVRALVPYVGLAVVMTVVLAVGLDDSLGSDYVLNQRLFSEWSVEPQLFSPHHGLLSSSPVLVFALLGFLPLARRDRQLGFAFALIVTAQLLLVGTSPGWNAGASFGARRFVSSALPFACGLAAAIDLARRRPMIPIGLLLVGLVSVNLALVDEVRRGTLNLSDTVSFQRMSEAISSRVGNPFVLPGALLFAWRHNIPIAFYDRIPPRKYERLRVNVGEPQDEVYLIGNWFDRESSPSGPFRWASRPEAGIFTQVRADRYRLRFLAQPFEWPDSPVQRIEVYLGRARLAEIPLAPGLREYELEIVEEQIPADDWMRVAFRLSHATAPREVTESQDTRPLAARFQLIELEPY